MSNPIENLKQIPELNPYDLNCNIFSVYDYDSLSIQELLCKFFEKINECIDIANATFKLAEWLVTVGLKQEVALTLNKWIEDGTLKEIINEEIFNDLNTKLNNAILDITSNKNSINELTDKFNKASKLLEYNVLDYDIDNTGVEDITDKLNTLINLVESVGGGNIRFPIGTYKVLNSIILKPHVHLVGAMPWRGKDVGGYSMFNCYSMNSPQFLLREYTGMKNFYFNYPEQGDTVATLKEYDWLISTDINHLCDDVQLSDLYFPNAYKGMNIVRSGRYNISNIYGNPIKMGLHIDQNFDVGNIDRVEFWTFNYYVGTEIFNYIKENGAAFEFARCDGGLFNNLFAFGYNKTFHFVGDVWGTFVGCCSDQSRHPILVDRCNMVEFIGGAFIGDRYDCIVCKINSVQGSFKLIGTNFFGNNNIGVLNKSNTGSIVIDSYFKNHDNKIKIPIINDGTQIIVRNNIIGERVYGACDINGVTSITQGGAIVVKEFNKDDFGFNQDVVNITNGFRVNMGDAVNGDKVISGFYRIDDKEEITRGIYYLEFTIVQKSSSDRKRFSIDIRNDVGTTIFNKIIDEYPFVDGYTTFRVPIYLPEKVYISGIKMTFNYYDEPNPTFDYMDILFMRFVKMSNKTLNSTVENAYKLYGGDKPIDYTIKE